MSNSKYKVLSSSGESHFFDTSDLIGLNSILLTSKTFHVLHENIGYTIEGVHRNGKQVSFLMNGTQYEFDILDANDQLVDALGFDKVAKVNLSSIASPMPGLIIDILVDEGQAFKEGDSLLILEAMKMENVIKAAADGVIKSINANTGDAVEKGQILLELE